MIRVMLETGQNVWINKIHVAAILEVDSNYTKVITSFGLEYTTRENLRDILEKMREY